MPIPPASRYAGTSNQIGRFAYPVQASARAEEHHEQAGQGRRYQGRRRLHSWWPFHLGLSAHDRLVELADVPDWICTALNPPSPRVVAFPYRPSFGRAPGKPTTRCRAFSTQ